MAKKPVTNPTMRLDMCGFEYFAEPFGFQFTKMWKGADKANVVLSTKNSAFIMYDKYIQMDINLPSRRIYGLGERQRQFLLEEGTWTMWANGQETPYDDGKGAKQTYGVHPFVRMARASPNSSDGFSAVPPNGRKAACLLCVLLLHQAA